MGPAARDDCTPYVAPADIPTPDQARTLLLYTMKRCPYCIHVARALRDLDLTVPSRDIKRDRAARHERRARTGRKQVPCLFIDDVPLFESEDIIAWLNAYERAHGEPS